MVLIYAFLWHLSRVPNFHGENPATCQVTFVVEIRHRFALGGMDYDDHTRRGGAGIYTYIMNNASIQSRKVNKGRHTLEMRMNGTSHDIPNTNHLREKR